MILYLYTFMNKQLLQILTNKKLLKYAGESILWFYFPTIYSGYKIIKIFI